MEIIPPIKKYLLGHVDTVENMYVFANATRVPNVHQSKIMSKTTVPASSTISTVKAGRTPLHTLSDSFL